VSSTSTTIPPTRTTLQARLTLRAEAARRALLPFGQFHVIELAQDLLDVAPVERVVEAQHVAT
jgi:hypothetical protein